MGSLQYNGILHKVVIVKEVKLFIYQGLSNSVSNILEAVRIAFIWFVLEIDLEPGFEFSLKMFVPFVTDLQTLFQLLGFLPLNESRFLGRDAVLNDVALRLSDCA